MTTKVELLTDLSTFGALHHLADTRRATVKVSREDLTNLLIDHSVMSKALTGSSSFKLVEPRLQVDTADSPSSEPKLVT